MSPERIAEMNARGDAAETIREAETQLARHEAALQLCRRVEAAFTGVVLGNGVSLSEAKALDDYESPEVCAQCREGDEKDDWSRIPLEQLNRHWVNAFFDAEGMRFHLPALLIADLRGEYHFDLWISLLAHSKYSMSQFSLLSGSQRAAVREFLEWRLSDPDCVSHEEITESLKNFWVKDDIIQESSRDS